MSTPPHLSCFVLFFMLFSAVNTVNKVIGLLSSTNVEEVVSCYEHAVTAVFPRHRYMPGYDARFVLWPLSLLPEWISDPLLVAFLPKPCP